MVNDNACDNYHYDNCAMKILTRSIFSDTVIQNGYISNKCNVLWLYTYGCYSKLLRMLRILNKSDPRLRLQTYFYINLDSKF